MGKSLLDVFGPYEIPCDHGSGNQKKIGKHHIEGFWGCDEVAPFADKHGCYVFALRASWGYTPWYVGAATKGMQKECFTDHKLGKYNDILWQGRQGTPVMFFVALAGTKRKVPKQTVLEVEKFLIHAAAAKNAKLANVKNARTLPNWGIKGIVRGGRGRPHDTSVAFAKMMALNA